jgi:hypothetical protein
MKPESMDLTTILFFYNKNEDRKLLRVKEIR